MTAASSAAYWANGARAHRAESVRLEREADAPGLTLAAATMLRHRAQRERHRAHEYDRLAALVELAPTGAP